MFLHERATLSACGDGHTLPVVVLKRFAGGGFLGREAFCRSSREDLPITGKPIRPWIFCNSKQVSTNSNSALSEQAISRQKNIFLKKDRNKKKL